MQVLKLWVTECGVMKTLATVRIFWMHNGAMNNFKYIMSLTGLAHVCLSKTRDVTSGKSFKGHWCRVPAKP